MHRRHRKKLPGLWLITDERVPDDALLAAAMRLPRGRAGILFRHYRTEAHARRNLFDALRAIARRRRLVLLIAGDRRDAAAWKADGWHGRGCKRLHRRMIRSAPAHDVREIVAAGRAGADMLLLSPLFPTRSHPGAPALGRTRFAALARRADGAVMALGGVKAVHRKMLRGIGADGWAAIDGLMRA
ncbi:thiamine phosphate synthase [Sphingobium sp.]|uniref:thiamine phosphate synthase n=1 Tax=Sphingobium sp. TaxID=1912891 RepID=UPI002C6D030E|nr:thiamine phosphate synthase [Sphingobium sp.]HUD92216.1 thiamine phosphate synthase [Sphingobium sp.]